MPSPFDFTTVDYPLIDLILLRVLAPNSTCEKLRYNKISQIGVNTRVDAILTKDGLLTHLGPKKMVNDWYP